MAVLKNENNQIRKVSSEIDLKFQKLEALVEEMVFYCKIYIKDI